MEYDHSREIEDMKNEIDKLQKINDGMIMLKVEEYQDVVQKNEYLVSQLDETKKDLKKTVDQFEALKIEKLEIEKQRDTVLQQVADMNGHTNSKQKIQYVENQKKEIIKKDNEIAKLKAQVNQLLKEKHAQ